MKSGPNKQSDVVVFTSVNSTFNNIPISVVHIHYYHFCFVYNIQ